MTGARTDRERYAVTYDAAGRPVDLMVLTTGNYRGSFDLPVRLQPAVGLLSTPTGHVRTYVEETHLDLTDPESLRAGACLPRAGPPSGRRPGRSRGRDRGRPAPAPGRGGVVHARTYDADERRYGVDGSVGSRACMSARRCRARCSTRTSWPPPPAAWTGCGACVAIAWRGRLRSSARRCGAARRSTASSRERGVAAVGARAAPLARCRSTAVHCRVCCRIGA